MADETARQPAEEPSIPEGDRPERRGAPTLAEPVDPALAAALDAFARGDFRTAAAQMPESVADASDDRAWLDRLRTGLGWEPSLWIAWGMCMAAWLWVYASVHPS